MYYRVVHSLDELLGEDGILRLPRYLPETFIMDDARNDIMRNAVRWLREGGNVLIEGEPGAGKTALMFMILKELSNSYTIGYILEGASQIGTEHMEKGIILFADDIPQMGANIVRFVIKQNIGGIVATARSEELAILERIVGADLRRSFRIFKLSPMSDDRIEEMLRKYLIAEAIRVAHEEAIHEVVKKAQGLPVYVWQVVRELKISREGSNIGICEEDSEWDAGLCR